MTARSCIGQRPDVTLASVAVRRLTAGDAAAYRSTRLRALLDAPDAFGSVHAIEAARPLSEYEQRLTAGASFGAFAGDRLVGIASFIVETGPKERHKGFLAGMYVEPEARGQGVGAALIHAAVDHATGVVEQIILHVVQDNGAAMGLYRRTGFVAFGVAPRSLKTPSGYLDEVLMVRFLIQG